MAGQQPSADTALRSSLVVLGAIAYSVAALAYRFRRHRDVYSGFTHAKVCLLLLLTYSMIASASSYNNVDSTVDDTNHNFYGKDRRRELAADIARNSRLEANLSVVDELFYWHLQEQEQVDCT